MLRNTFPVPRTLLLLCLLALTIGYAHAATLTVGPGAYATIQAAINAASPGDTIDIPVGIYPENLSLTKPLTLRGPNAGITPNTPGNPEVMNPARGSEAVIAPAGGRGIFISGAADNVTIDGLAFSAAYRGVYIGYPDDGVISNLSVVNNYFFDMVGLGIQCITSAGRDNWVIANNRFDGWSDVDSSAIWLAGSTNVSTLVADNFIRGTDGAVRSRGILLDNGTGAVIRGNYLTQLSMHAIQITNWQGSVESATITDNIIWNVNSGIQLADGASVPNSYYHNVTVERNTITNVTDFAFRTWKLTGDPFVFDSPLANIVFRQNILNQDVGLLTQNGALVNFCLSQNILLHGNMIVADNTINLHGTFTGGTTAAYAIAARGNISTMSITGNTLTSTAPAGTTGIMLVSNDTDWGALPAIAQFTIEGNHISGFENGLGAYDLAAATYGNLPEGISVQVHSNQIAGNFGYGVRNDGTSAILDAMDNDWGAASGPSGGVTDPISGAVANGTGDRVSTNVHFANANNPPVANNQLTSTQEDIATVVTLTGSDPDGNQVTFTIVSGPTHGTLTGTAPVLTYTPAANYSGTDSFTYTVTDGQLTSAPATVTITIQATKLEGDVAPRPLGNAAVSSTDLTQDGRFVVGLDTLLAGSEFQRADTAPRSTLGDGQITVADWLQTARYAAGLDSLVLAGGSTGAGLSPAAQGMTLTKVQLVKLPTREVLIPKTTLRRGRTSTVTLALTGQGNESALGCTLNFDPTRLQFVSAVAANSANTIVVNSAQAAQGKIAVIIMRPLPQTFPTLQSNVVTLTFSVPSTTPTGTTNITFSNGLTACAVVNAQAENLTSKFTAGAITISK